MSELITILILFIGYLEIIIFGIRKKDYYCNNDTELFDAFENSTIYF